MTVYFMPCIPIAVNLTYCSYSFTLVQQHYYLNRPFLYIQLPYLSWSPILTSLSLGPGKFSCSSQTSYLTLSLGPAALGSASPLCHICLCCKPLCDKRQEQIHEPQDNLLGTDTLISSDHQDVGGRKYLFSNSMPKIPHKSFQNFEMNKLLQLETISAGSQKKCFMSCCTS